MDKIQKVECPKCGSRDTWVDSTIHLRRLCQSCGTEFTIQSATPSQPEPQPKPKPVNVETNETSYQVPGVLFTITIIIVIAVFIFIMAACYRLTDHTARNARVTKDGFYEITALPGCLYEDIIISYGEEFKEPATTVKVGERWGEIPNFEGKNVYFKVSCIGSPELNYFGYQFPPPVPGMMVITEGYWDSVKATEKPTLEATEEEQ